MCGTVAAKWRAFSLIELVLVVAIIGVMAAITVPRYAVALTRYHADAAAHRLSNELNHAATEARITSSARRVVVDANTGTLAITASTPNGVEITSQVDLSRAPYDATVLSSDFTSNNPLIFDGYGQADRSGSVVLTVGSERRRITISAATGEVSIQ